MTKPGAAVAPKSWEYRQGAFPPDSGLHLKEAQIAENTAVLLLVTLLLKHIRTCPKTH